MGLFEGTQKRVQNSRGKRVIGVRAIEVSVYTVRSLKFGPRFPGLSGEI